MGKRSSIAKRNYRLSEMERLLSEGVSLSKISKMLGIPYQLAATYKTLIDEE